MDIPTLLENGKKKNIFITESNVDRSQWQNKHNRIFLATTFRATLPDFLSELGMSSSRLTSEVAEMEDQLSSNLHGGSSTQLASPPFGAVVAVSGDRNRDAGSSVAAFDFGGGSFPTFGEISRSRYNPDAFISYAKYASNFICISQNHDFFLNYT